MSSITLSGFLITVCVMYKPLTTEQNSVQLAAGTLSPPQSCTSAGMLMCLQQQGWSAGPKSHLDVDVELLFPVTSCTDSHLHIRTPAVIRTLHNEQYNTQKCSTSACNYILNLDVVRCV